MKAWRGFGAAVLALSAVLMAGVLAGLPGCASAPVVRLHTLVSADLAPAPAAGAASLPVVLQVGRVPLQVDQPQWLVRQPDDTLRLLEQERWAAPLRDELRAALLQALAARGGVIDASDAGAAAGGAAAAWRVLVDVTRFESLPGREARLDASWSLTAPGATVPLLSCRSVLREPVGDGAPALAAGHRRAVVALADQLGRALREGAAAACPAVPTPG